MNVIEEFQTSLRNIESKVSSILKNQNDVDELTNKVNQLEFNLTDYENYLLKELELLEASFEQMRKGIKNQNSKLARILKAIPPNILEEAAARAAENEECRSPSSLQSDSKSKSKSKSDSNSSQSTVKHISGKSESSVKGSKQPPVPVSSTLRRSASPKMSSKSNDQSTKNQDDFKKPVFKKSIDLITKEEFAKIPTYVVGRNTIEKVNGLVAELNVLLQDKLTILGIPEHKLIKQQDRDVVHMFKQLQTKETKGYFFFTEKELKDKQGWTKSKFIFSAVGRNVLTILRTLGRLKEVRGGQATRYVLV